MAHSNILTIVVLVLDILALIGIFRSSISGGKKFLWFLAVFFLPIVGAALWFILHWNKKGTL